MLHLQHGHYRPDAVMRSSIVEPYDIQRYNPVLVARQTINPFIYGIRPPGPQSGGPAAMPTATQVAQAAQAVAQQFAQGRPAQVTAGGQTQMVAPGSVSPSPVINQIVQAAQGLVASGQPVPVSMPGSPPSVAMPPSAGPPSAATTRPPQAPTAAQGPAPSGSSQTATMTPSSMTSTRPTGTVVKHVSPKYQPSPYAQPRTRAQKIISAAFGDAGTNPVSAAPNPFHVALQTALLAQGRGWSPSWRSASLVAQRHAAAPMFSLMGLAPAMSALPSYGVVSNPNAAAWAAANAGQGSYQQVRMLTGRR